MSVVLFGSRGFVGRHLVQRLRSDRKTVCAYSSSSSDNIDPSSGTLVNGFALPKETKAVIYLAQSPHYCSPSSHVEHLYNVNAYTPATVARLALKAGVRRFLYASTGNVYSPSFTPLIETEAVLGGDEYTRSKLAGEEALTELAGDLDITILRPFGIYGPGQSGMLVANLIDRIRTKQPILLQKHPNNPDDKDGLRVSLCFIDDAVAMICDLLQTSGPPVLNLAGETAVSIRTLGETLGTLLGVDVQFQISDKPRTFDLIANTDLLIRTLTPPFTSLLDGLKATVEAMPKDMDT